MHACPAESYAFVRGNPGSTPGIPTDIKKYRNKIGVSQDRLSKLADVTYNIIIKIEPGTNKNPTIETLSKIAKALKVGVDDLIK
ncbi:MAG: helix-turn-helix transcriptional regulator [Patescibacteria group bacterium]|nr:helix-turn-helix transcriptional regulator [Patescibacteria group bacterium]